MNTSYLTPDPESDALNNYNNFKSELDSKMAKARSLASKANSAGAIINSSAQLDIGFELSVGIGRLSSALSKL